MIDVSTDTVRRLAGLAREIHADTASTAEQTDDAPPIDWEQESDSTEGPNTGVGEFRAIVEDLEPDQQQHVVALMWLGRGDFEAEEWDEVVALAEERWSEDTATYLLSHPMLADELEAGLAALGFEETA
jgi:hypothetical protein